MKTRELKNGTEVLELLADGKPHLCYMTVWNQDDTKTDITVQIWREHLIGRYFVMASDSEDYELYSTVMFPLHPKSEFLGLIPLWIYFYVIEETT